MYICMPILPTLAHRARQYIYIRIYIYGFIRIRICVCVYNLYIQINAGALVWRGAAGLCVACVRACTRVLVWCRRIPFTFTYIYTYTHVLIL